MDEIIEIEIDEKEYFDKSQYDDGYIVKDYADFINDKGKDTHVAVSPDGSIVATFNSGDITIIKVATNEMNILLSDDDILGWSLAVTDIIENNIGFVAISGITKEDMNPKEVNEFRMADDIDDIEQFKLSWISSKGTIQLFKFELNDSTNHHFNTPKSPIYKKSLGGVIGFLKTSKTSENSDSDSVTLVCTNYIGIHKINIRLSGNKFEKYSSYLLPEILYKKLKNVKDETHKLEYLSKSRYQEFLMVDVNNHQTVQNIEIYNINTLQLVTVFYKYQDPLITKNNKPGIFAISTDSRLLAYSYGNNTIAIYLMENGLEVVLKKFDNISNIKFLEFIKEDEKLFIIEENRGDVKFHVWVISGCLNDYFPIPIDSKDTKDHILLSDNNDFVTEYKKYIPDMEPWIDNTPDTEPWTRGFLNNDKRFLLIIGQNSIQLWKSKSQNFKDFKDFKSFENSDLVNISISKFSFESRPKFQIKNDMTTVIIDACKSLVYLHTLNNTNSEEKCQKYVIGITNIIKDFIKKYPDNWKLMEVQYPLMVYLIISRSFSLIKYVLFGDNGQEKNADFLHKPQSKCVSDYDMDWDLNLNDLKLNNLDLNELDLDLNKLKLNDSVLASKLKNLKNILNDLKLEDLKKSKYRDLIDSELALNLNNLKLNDINLVDSNLNLKLNKLKSTLELNDLNLNRLKNLDLIDSELYSKLKDFKLNNLDLNELKLNDSELASKLKNLKNVLNDLKLEDLKKSKYKDLIDSELALNLDNLKLNDINLVDSNLNLKLNKLKSKLELNDLNLNRLKDLGLIDSKLYSKLKDLKLNDLNLNDVKLNDVKLNHLELALKLDQDQDAVMLAYLLEYYSENAMTHTGWMNNVIEIFPKLPEHYLETLFYKPCFGGMKFNFSNKRFEVSNDSLKLEVYLPVTWLMPAKSISFLQYKEIRNEELSNIFIYYIFGDEKLSPILTFLQGNQHKSSVAYFDAPVFEAFTTSRWKRAKRHWETRLMFYITFLFLFSFLSQLFLSDYDNQNKHNAMFMIVVGIFYYVGMFVLFGHPSLFDLNLTVPTFTLNDGTGNFTLTGESPDNTFDTIWGAILSAYYWGSINGSTYHYWPLKLFTFIGNVILVLVLSNMIIALMSDTFTQAKKYGIIGLLLFRTDLIHDYESINNPGYNPLYICFQRDSDMIKNWVEKSHELEETKLYSWFNDESM
ncbi:hypothetical protein RhiirA4_482104 [Rhizophagus irregularis]|uniref:Ion transport domain-containing protein n=1 Tax=Rhizophagus irregularis TaxID=588596 RepID=A0A2I1HKI5_9GLOM|nr:hypothetical protein RhiirA4_482104 [Rhizophagus irregularis]